MNNYSIQDWIIFALWIFFHTTLLGLTFLQADPYLGASLCLSQNTGENIVNIFKYYYNFLYF